MLKREMPDAERAAMVVHRKDGRWEVQVSETEGTDGSRRWRHKKMFSTEQEAEIYARSLLPYSDMAWAIVSSLWDNIPDDKVYVRRPAKRRKPMHTSEA